MSKKIHASATTPDRKRENLVLKTRKPEISPSINSPTDQIMHLQRIVGNQAVERLFKSSMIQEKIRIGQTNAIYQAVQSGHYRTEPNSLQLQENAQENTTNASYPQALELLKGLDPEISAYLSKVALGTDSTVIWKEQIKTDKDIYIFELTLSVKADLGKGSKAHFKDQYSQDGVGFKYQETIKTFQWPMEIHLPDNLDLSTLSKSLHHEGIHMLLSIERFRENTKQFGLQGLMAESKHQKSFQEYLQIAGQHDKWLELQVTIEASIIEKVKDSKEREKITKRIMEGLVEEKYVYDTAKNAEKTGHDLNVWIATQYPASILQTNNLYNATIAGEIGKALVLILDHIDSVRSPKAPTKIE